MKRAVLSEKDTWSRCEGEDSRVGWKRYPGRLHNNGRHVRSISVEVSRKINGSEQGRGGWVIYLRARGAAAGGSVSNVKASRQKENAGEVEEDALSERCKKGEKKKMLVQRRRGNDKEREATGFLFNLPDCECMWWRGCDVSGWWWQLSLSLIYSSNSEPRFTGTQGCYWHALRLPQK